jgi:pentatricopeptide repeat protein
MLRLCVASKEWDNVLVVMDVMNQQNLTLTRDHSTYQACLQACFEVGRGATAIEILSSMEVAKVTSTPSDMALVIAAMCRNEKTESGWWRRALGLIRAFTQQQHDKVPSLVLPVEAYDAVLSCMVKERQWQEAIRLVRQMENMTATTNGNEFGGVHPVPQLSTYRMVIECCLSAGQADQAFQVLNSMTERGIKVCPFRTSGLRVLVTTVFPASFRWYKWVQTIAYLTFCHFPPPTHAQSTNLSSQRCTPLNWSFQPCRKSYNGVGPCNYWT